MKLQRGVYEESTYAGAGLFEQMVCLHGQVAYMHLFSLHILLVQAPPPNTQTPPPNTYPGAEWVAVNSTNVPSEWLVKVNHF